MRSEIHDQKISQPTKTDQKPLGEILQNAAKRSLGGGLAGAGAMVVQVSTLMWMRTIMNYQYLVAFRVDFWGVLKAISLFVIELEKS